MWFFSPRSVSSYTSSLFREFEPSIASHLLKHGYAVIDNALENHTRITQCLRAEIDYLASLPGSLATNETIFLQPAARNSKKSSVLRLRKSNVREIELHTADDDLRAKLPALVGLEQDRGLAAMLSVYIPQLTLTKQALKAQHIVGKGACYPIHVDSDPTVDERIVTAILYLNKDWDLNRDGGALRVYPIRNFREKSKCLDIEPVDGRIVLLSTTEMHHRVLKTLSPRYAVTLWLFGRFRNRKPDSEEIGTDSNDLGAILVSRRYRKHVVRLSLAEEWEQSLLECHATHDAILAVETHREEITRTRQAIAKDISLRYVSFSQDFVIEVLRHKHHIESLILQSDPTKSSATYLF